MLGLAKEFAKLDNQSGSTQQVAIQTEPLVYATVTYDQGATVGSNLQNDLIQVGEITLAAAIRGLVPSSYISIIFASSLSLIAFAIAIRYKKIKQIRDRKSLENLALP